MCFAEVSQARRRETKRDFNRNLRVFRKICGEKEFLNPTLHMEPKFQSSFIPKTPVTTSSVSRPPSARTFKTSVSFLPSLGTVLFILALLASLGLFGYERLLNSQVADDSKALVLAKSAFDTDTISRLLTASAQIQSAKTLLNNHVAVSGMFAVLESNVVPKARFTGFNFERNDDGTVKVTAEGEAQSYAVMAEQSLLFSKISYMSNQNFTDLDLTDKGAVSMKFITNIDPKLVSFSQALSSIDNSSGN